MILKSLFAQFEHMLTAYKLTQEPSKLCLSFYRCAAFAAFDFPGDIMMGAWSKESIPEPISEYVYFGVGALETLRLPAAMEGPRARPTCNYHQHALLELCPGARG
jgi:hypothetical protein